MRTLKCLIYIAKFRPAFLYLSRRRSKKDGDQEDEENEARISYGEMHIQLCSLACQRMVGEEIEEKKEIEPLIGKREIRENLELLLLTFDTASRRQKLTN